MACGSSWPRAGPGRTPGGLRGFHLELVGEDRLGIVSRLTRTLAEQGISIDQLLTELVGSTAGGKPKFRVSAHLLAPAGLAPDALLGRLGALPMK